MSYAPVKRVTPGEVIAHRKRHGISQRALAALAGVSVKTLRDFERAARPPIGRTERLIRHAVRGPQPAGVDAITNLAERVAKLERLVKDLLPAA